jgi:FADH2 O2-dependent halogenase
LPSVSDQFSNADASMDFVHARKLSFLSERIVGERWALLPSAAGFIDPLLSTGFPLTLLGIGRLATVIDECWETGEFSQPLKQYAAATREDLLAAADLVGALYRCMNDFELFRSVSKLYFAAVVYSESARRLGKAHLVDSFLLRSNPLFGPRVREICERIKQPLDVDEKRTLVREIERIIEPFDVAGLNDPTRKTRYPVVAKDLLDNSWKLEAGRDEVRAMLERSGFWA